MRGKHLMFGCVFILIAAFSSFEGMAQTRVIIGQIRDQHSGEPVPFASVQFKTSGIGKLADSAGTFILRFGKETRDTLEITSVGYQDYLIYVDGIAMSGDSLKMIFQMVPGKFTTEVVVRKKVNRG